MEYIIVIVILLAIIMLSRFLIMGAIDLLGWATEGGFIGVAAYFASWVFLLPFMIVGCIIIGIYGRMIVAKQE